MKEIKYYKNGVENMKDKIKKDNENIEETNKKKIDIKKILCIIVMILISVVCIVFLSTYIRWQSFIEDKEEVLVYKEEENYIYEIDDKIKYVTEIKDFYDNKIEDFVINENEVAIMYCGKKDRDNCNYVNYSDMDFKIITNPSVIIFTALIVDLLGTLYLLRKNEKISKIYIRIAGGVILLLGLIIIGKEIYKVADYYLLANDSEYLVNSKIVAVIKDDYDEKKIKPVSTYIIGEKEYVYYSNDLIDAKVGDELTLYYDKNDYKIATMKTNPFNAIDFILGSGFVIVGSIYFISVKEEKEKRGKLKKNKR